VASSWLVLLALRSGHAAPHLPAEVGRAGRKAGDSGTRIVRGRVPHAAANGVVGLMLDRCFGKAKERVAIDRRARGAPGDAGDVARARRILLRKLNGVDEAAEH
jgi:hypothetical protein